MKFSCVRLSVFFCVFALLSAGCDGSDPALTFDSPALDFGRIALTGTAQRTLVLKNLTEKSATLRDLSPEALGVAAPFELLAESTCTTGMVLQAGSGMCTLVFRFSPTAVGVFGFPLNLRYRFAEADADRSTAAQISGEGFLDCAFTPDHPLCPEDADLSFTPARELNFGRVDVTFDATQIVTITNTDADESVTLGTINPSTLGISAPFTLLPGTTCTSGMILASQTGSCVIAIRVNPVAPGEMAFTLSVPFTEEHNTLLETARLPVRAVGNLNCVRTPDHPLCPEDADVHFSGEPEVDFGSVDIFTSSSRVITVTNTDVDETVTLGEISDAALHIGTEYQVIAGTTCETGMVLAANGGNCALVIEYFPTSNAFQREILDLSFVEQNNTLIEVANVRFVGYGMLNCALDSGLAASRASGVTEAQTRNAAEAARGRTDGAALTYEDGRRRTYTDAYNAAYGTAYDFAYGTSYTRAYDTGYRREYDRSYRSTYTDRFTQLVSDTSVCSRGATSGRADGETAGFTDGSYDGYADGYAIGYPFGGDDGYSEGVDSAYADCTAAGGTPSYDATEPFPGFSGPAASSSSRGGERPGISPMDAVFVTGCYNQGYNTTLDANAYWNAFNAAVAANSEYQRGLREGTSQGTANGTRDGTALGNTNGTLAGDGDGALRGRSDGVAEALVDAELAAEPVREGIYNDCYASSYASGYSGQYTYWYDAEYDSGYTDGYNDGHDDTFGTGYNDVECCRYDWSDFDGDYIWTCTRGSFAQERSLAPGQLTRGRGSRYGTGKSWWVASGEGTMGDRFVRSRAPLWYAREAGVAAAAKLELGRAITRGMEIRSALRQEKRLSPPATPRRR